jgi:hypothetical protein
VPGNDLIHRLAWMPRQRCAQVVRNAGQQHFRLRAENIRDQARAIGHESAGYAASA